MGLCTNRQMIMNTIYGQISYHYCHSKAFKAKLAHDQEIFYFRIRRATGKEIAERIIKPVNLIPASHVKARCAQLLIITPRLWKDLKRVEERRVRTMVGKKIILASMSFLIDRMELIILHSYIFVPMVACL